MQATRTTTSDYDEYVKLLWKDLVSNAKSRRINVEITLEDITDLYDKQNGLCALTNIQMTHTKRAGKGRKKCPPCNISVDRIDSSKPYAKNNIQLVCSSANTIKWDQSMADFILICRKISEKFKDVKIVSCPCCKANFTQDALSDHVSSSHLQFADE